MLLGLVSHAVVWCSSRQEELFCQRLQLFLIRSIKILKEGGEETDVTNGTESFAASFAQFCKEGATNNLSITRTECRDQGIAGRLLVQLREALASTAQLLCHRSSLVSTAGVHVIGAPTSGCFEPCFLVQCSQSKLRRRNVTEELFTVAQQLHNNINSHAFFFGCNFYVFLFGFE